MVFSHQRIISPWPGPFAARKRQIRPNVDGLPKTSARRALRRQTVRGTDPSDGEHILRGEQNAPISELYGHGN